ncbi:hypothetical protein M6D76_08605 [Alcaligenes faecalis]|uniref:hypothetical protein n=1 Tax=Alcaligenes faecalis TaxID=511 RepID=UPI00211CE074|nr:hypothetical protein [Alcaligenes faecalis]UUO12721.1 hypothetical protein M6D76_08605 [Alcaligenes faecalis]
MAIKRSVEIDVDPTPEELASCFWELGSFDQAKFFNHLGRIASHNLPMQMQCVTDDNVLTSEGRYAMRRIGDYSEATHE